MIFMTHVLLALWIAWTLSWFSPMRASNRLVVNLSTLTVNAVYFAWRSTNMPPLELTFASYWVLGFFLLESLALAYESWCYVVMLRRSEYSREADKFSSFLRSNPDECETVDSLICTCGEPHAVVEKTVRATTQIEYPMGKHAVYVLDDKHDKRIEQLCQQYGAIYVARERPVKPDYKGGNLENGRKVSSKMSAGRFLFLLDADFVCEPDVLYRMSGFLTFAPYKGHVGVCQAGQCFRNADPISHNLMSAHLLPDDQAFFMQAYLPSRDAWGTAFSVGTCALVDRKAIEDIGGFPKKTITEDLEMSMKLLMSLGLRTLILNAPLAFGLAPADVATFLKQRIRWCVGTFQHLLISEGPLTGRYTLLQRLFYLEGIFYWLTFFSLLAFLLAPAVFWITGVSAIPGPPDAALSAVSLRLAFRLPTALWLSGGLWTPLFTYVSKSLACVHLTLAMARFPFAPWLPFRVANAESEKPPVQWWLIFFFSVLGLATIGGMFLRLLDGTYSSQNMAFNVIWSILNVITCVLAVLVCFELPRHARDQLGHNVEVLRGRPMQAMVNTFLRVFYDPKRVAPLWERLPLDRK